MAGECVRGGDTEWLTPDCPCWLGIQTPHLGTSRSADDDSIRARILAVTPMHWKAVLLLKLTDDTEWLAALPPRAVDWATAEDVFIRFAPGDALLFDRTCGAGVCLSLRRQTA